MCVIDEKGTKLCTKMVAALIALINRDTGEITFPKSKNYTLYDYLIAIHETECDKGSDCWYCPEKEASNSISMKELTSLAQKQYAFLNRPEPIPRESCYICIIGKYMELHEPCRDHCENYDSEQFSAVMKERERICKMFFDFFLRSDGSHLVVSVFTDLLQSKHNDAKMIAELSAKNIFVAIPCKQNIDNSRVCIIPKQGTTNIDKANNFFDRLSKHYSGSLFEKSKASASASASASAGSSALPAVVVPVPVPVSGKPSGIAGSSAVSSALPGVVVPVSGKPSEIAGAGAVSPASSSMAVAASAVSPSSSNVVPVSGTSNASRDEVPVFDHESSEVQEQIIELIRSSINQQQIGSAFNRLYGKMPGFEKSDKSKHIFGSYKKAIDFGIDKGFYRKKMTGRLPTDFIYEICKEQITEKPAFVVSGSASRARVPAVAPAVAPAPAPAPAPVPAPAVPAPAPAPVPAPAALVPAIVPVQKVPVMMSDCSISDCSLVKSLLDLTDEEILGLKTINKGDLTKLTLEEQKKLLARTQQAINERKQQQEAIYAEFVKTMSEAGITIVDD